MDQSHIFYEQIEAVVEYCRSLSFWLRASPAAGSPRPSVSPLALPASPSAPAAVDDDGNRDRDGARVAPCPIQSCIYMSSLSSLSYLRPCIRTSVNAGTQTDGAKAAPSCPLASPAPQSAAQSTQAARPVWGFVGRGEAERGAVGWRRGERRGEGRRGKEREGKRREGERQGRPSSFCWRRVGLRLAAAREPHASPRPNGGALTPINGLAVSRNYRYS